MKGTTILRIGHVRYACRHWSLVHFKIPACEPAGLFNWLLLFFAELFDPAYGELEYRALWIGNLGLDLVAAGNDTVKQHHVLIRNLPHLGYWYVRLCGCFNSFCWNSRTSFINLQILAQTAIAESLRKPYQSIEDEASGQPTPRRLEAQAMHELRVTQEEESRDREVSSG